jgi:hypothetical protein
MENNDHQTANNSLIHFSPHINNLPINLIRAFSRLYSLYGDYTGQRAKIGHIYSSKKD